MSGSYVISNPILRGMYPDPSWIWDSTRNEAVLVCSTFTVVPGLPLFASRDLSKWEHIGNAVDEAMAKRLLLRFTEDSGGLYAPTLRRIGGKYYIVCTVARLDHEAARMNGVSEDKLAEISASDGNFIIEADSLEGPWLGPTWINGADGIDPDIFEDSDGTVYWTQTRPAKEPAWEGQTEVWTQKLNPQTGELLGEPFVLWRGYGRDAVWAEAPHLYRIGDFVYLFTAEGGTSFEHSEMAMRANAPEGFGVALDQVLGSDTKIAHGYDVSTVLFHANKKNPIVTHRHLGLEEPIQCVGHSDLLLHPTLGWWLVCLGVRETHAAQSDIDICSFLGRESFVAPVKWEKNPAEWTLDAAIKDTSEKDKKDPGWPVVAPGLGKLPKAIHVDVDNDVHYQYETQSQQQDSVLQYRNDSKDFVRVVNDDLSWRYVRLPSDQTFITTSTDSIKVFQDSKNSLVLDTRNGILETCIRGVQNEQKVSGNEIGERFALLFDKGSFRIMSLQNLYVQVPLLSLTIGEAAHELIPETNECFSMDATFLATEKTGGFVGCLVGIR